MHVSAQLPNIHWRACPLFWLNEHKSTSNSIINKTFAYLFSSSVWYDLWYKHRQFLFPSSIRSINFAHTNYAKSGSKLCLITEKEHARPNRAEINCFLEYYCVLWLLSWWRRGQMKEKKLPNQANKEHQTNIYITLDILTRS